MLSSLDVKNEEKDSNGGNGTVLPRPLPVSGMTLLSVTIDKISLKDAGQYLDPFISVSVRGMLVVTTVQMRLDF